MKYRIDLIQNKHRKNFNEQFKNNFLECKQIDIRFLKTF